ncbi:MAG TPA: lysophospholipid acyltransferase family protein [Pedobacter sp.]
MLKRAVSYFGVFLLYALSLLPLQVLYLFATFTYWLLYYIFGYRRAVVRTNLENAFPEKSKEEISLIEKRYYKYLSALIFEIIKMSTISKRELQKRFKFKNTGLINTYLERGESVLACSAHYGNWEWGTLSIGLSLKGTSYPIYKPLSNQIFDKWFYDIRSRFGNHMISMRQTYRALTESKNEPTIFYFGSDQTPPKEESNYWTTFLNQQTSIQMGLEKIAIKTNRPVFYLKTAVLKKGYYEVDCIPVCLHPDQTTGHEITDIHVRFLEDLIREEPAYWLWSHRRWKHQPG